MWTRAETVFTTTSMTAVSVSTRIAQLAESAPELIQRSTSTFITCGSCRKPTKTYQERMAAIAEQRRRQVHRPHRAVIMAVVAVIVMRAVVAVMAGMGMGMVLAIDVGVAAQALEDLGAEKPGDQRAEERQEDDGG